MIGQSPAGPYPDKTPPPELFKYPAAAVLLDGWIIYTQPVSRISSASQHFGDDENQQRSTESASEQ
jgi:hypothetical protein